MNGFQIEPMFPRTSHDVENTPDWSNLQYVKPSSMTTTGYPTSNLSFSLNQTHQLSRPLSCQKSTHVIGLPECYAFIGLKCTSRDPPFVQMSGGMRLHWTSHVSLLHVSMYKSTKAKTAHNWLRHRLNPAFQSIIRKREGACAASSTDPSQQPF